MQILMVSQVIIAGAVLALVLLVVRLMLRRARIRKQLLPALKAAGLQISGDPFGGYELHGNYEGIDLRLGNRSSLRPPWEHHTKDLLSCATVTFWAPVPNSIVCRWYERDRVAVHFPPVAQVGTGFAEFDAAFAVFVDPYRRPAAHPGSSSANLRWPPSETLGVFVEMNLRWLHVNNETAVLVLPTINDPRDIERVLSLASMLAHGARGSTLTRRLPHGPWSSFPAHGSAAPSIILGTAFFLAFLAAIIGAAALDLVPIVREIFAPDVCGAGQQLLVSAWNSGGRGSSYRLYCSGNPRAPVDLMSTLCATASAALVLAPATLLALVTELRGSLRKSSNA